MDMWQMLEKFCAEVVDSSSDEESDQSTHTLATTAASMIHEFNSNQGLVHRGFQDARGLQERCGAWIWCAPSSVGNCPSPGTWSLHEVMTCCVIMHNMIVENERPDGRNENHWKFQGELVAPLPGALSWENYLHMNLEVTDENVFKWLQTDLIEHQWVLAGHEDHA
ncbi:hypothetical protein QYE76_005779 [Lolium multiflorum]|uniref:Uncharacterized protein n=1 Tax=Lolium multiflorum TaxID=4521 RepID=A0AAD8RUQ3_LOLMU|nr:hypothetical protein QYE76_005779 [Lolium multiflorum]